MPDFGIMRGFNERLFGDKLVAGQLPTQLGLIGSQEVFDTDADAQAFFDRVTVAGGTLSATEKSAVNTLVIQMKADGIWSAMKAIYPMVGASAAACAQNLKSSSFTGTFTSGWTFASTGVTPNGTSAFMDTGLNPSTQLTANSLHLSFYSRTQNSTAGYDLAQGGLTLNIICSYLGATGYFGYDTLYNYVNTDSRGFYLGSRSSSTFKGYRNNVVKINVTPTTPTFGSSPILIGAYQGPVDFSTKQSAFVSIGDGLDDTQASNFYTAVQAMQTTLSRQV